MARIPSSPRKAPTAEDQHGDDRPVAEDRARAVGTQVDDRTGYRSSAAVAERERTAAEKDGAATEHDPSAPDRATPAERPEVAPAGPRPRASVMATVGLVFAVAAALTVLTGDLAAYGIALAVVGLLFSIGGLSATRRRHIAGKSDALLGIVLSSAAVVLGGLAVAGLLPWLSPHTSKVGQVRDWLDAHIANRF